MKDNLSKTLGRIKRQLLGGNTPPSSQGLCTLSLGSKILPEGEIENIQGNPECIQLGRNTFLRGKLLVYGHGGMIRIGDSCYVGHRTDIWSMEAITIGDRVLISHDVQIHDGTAHSLDPKERAEHFSAIVQSGHPKDWGKLPGVDSAPIVIENDVWISFGVTILKGVRIGEGAVIGATSIVTRDVPPYTLYTNIVSPQLKPLPKTRDIR